MMSMFMAYDSLHMEFARNQQKVESNLAHIIRSNKSITYSRFIISLRNGFSASIW